MLVVISPAKRLDWPDARSPGSTVPAFAAEAAPLARRAARLSRKDLRRLMSISDDLARLNQARFRRFCPDPGPEATRQAIRALRATPIGASMPVR